MYETVALLNVLNGSKLLILFMLWKEHLRETTTLMKYKKKTYKLTICAITTRQQFCADISTLFQSHRRTRRPLKQSGNITAKSLLSCCSYLHLTIRQYSSEYVVFSCKKIQYYEEISMHNTFFTLQRDRFRVMHPYILPRLLLLHRWRHLVCRAILRLVYLLSKPRHNQR